MSDAYLHFDVLPESQQKVWSTLAPLSNMGFVLYGGTAVALHLGHRFSVDFDFFSKNKFKKSNIFNLISVCKKIRIIQEEENTLSFFTNNDVKISLFGNINFGRIGIPITDKTTGLQVASRADLLSLKLATIFERVSVKDYVDVAALLRSGESLAAGLAGALALYGNQFPPMIAVKALTYFDSPELKSLSAQDRKLLLNAAMKLGALPEVTLVSHELFDVTQRFRVREEQHDKGEGMTPI